MGISRLFAQSVARKQMGSLMQQVADALLQALGDAAYHFKRIRLEAWPPSQWLFSAFAEASLPVIRKRWELAKVGQKRKE
jgi:hypothetical protein